jgi:hypothetical protein
MDPVFTLQWSEYVLAERLQSALPKADGFSVWIPLSRQEKGVDLAVLRKQPDGSTRTVTIQVKASRTYLTDEPKRDTTERHLFHSWFNRFAVSKDADFFLLFGQYAPDVTRTRQVSAKWYRDMTLLLSNAEMQEFIDKCKTVKTGADDPMFGFGFDDESKIVQVRGDATRSQRDFTPFLLSNSFDRIRTALGA